jgi:hypothetical protein
MAGCGDGFESRIHAERAKEMADVISNRFRTHVELISDLFGGASLLEKTKHLGLAGSQMGVWRSRLFAERPGQ